MRNNGWGVALFGLSLFAGASVAQATPDTMAFSGRLLDAAGEPVTGSPLVRIALHTDPATDSEVWFEQHTLSASDGYFTVQLGRTNTALSDIVRQYDALWAQTEIDGIATGARQALNAVPYAMRSPLDDLECADGATLRYSSSAGGWTCGPSDGGLLSMQVFESSGTWVKPPGVTRIEVIVTGGGGGGGSHNTDDAQGGGGAGGTAIEILDVTNVESVPVTVGAGGTGSCGNTNVGGQGGGTSSFGSFLSATGGSPVPTWGVGGPGGIGQGGDLNLRGNDGGTGNIDGQGNEEAGGSGGASYWGGAGRGASHWASNRRGFHGSGGGGDHASRNTCGGRGGDGLVVVREYGG